MGNLNSNFLTQINDLRSYIYSLIAEYSKNGFFENINGLSNSKYDYEFAVARFMRMKELFINKIKVVDEHFESRTNNGKTKNVKVDDSYDNLYFDIVCARKFLWDLLFISEIVKKKMYDKGFKNNFLNSLNEKSPYIKIHDSDNDCEKTMNILADLCGLDFSGSLDNSLLELLVEAICIFDSIRNSFGHNEEGVKCYVKEIDGVRYVHIYNSTAKNFIDVDIELDYFCNFGIGIIPKIDDLEIAEIVDVNHAEIFKAFNFSLKDNIDLLYKTSPDRLNFLLNFVNNDFQKLIDLPTILFSSNVTSERIELLLSLTNDFELIKRLPAGFFSKKCSQKRLEELCLGPVDLEALVGLPNILFLCSDSTLEIYEELIDLGIDFDDLSKLPHGVFSNAASVEKIRYFLYLDDEPRISNIAYLPSKIFTGLYRLDKIKMIIKTQDDIHYLSIFPVELFNMEFSERKWNFIHNKFNDINCVCCLPKIAFSLKCPDSRFEFIINNFSLYQILKLPGFFFSDICDEKKFQELINVFPFEELIKLPEGIAMSDDINYVLKASKNNSFDCSIFSKLPSEFYICKSRFDIVKYLFDIPYTDEVMIVKYISEHDDIVNALKRIPMSLFRNCVVGNKKKYDSLVQENLLKLNILLGNPKNVANLFGLGDFVFSLSFSAMSLKFLLGENFDLTVLHKLGERKYSSLRNLFCFEKVNYERILKICDGHVDIDVLNSFPMHLLNYTCDDNYFDYILKLVDYDYSLITNLPSSIFTYPNLEKIKFFVGESGNYIDLLRVPASCFASNCSLDRIKYILEKINGDYSILNKLPNDIFFCNIKIVDQILSSVADRDLNLKKAILGFNDDLAVAVAFYMNLLFGSTDVNNNKFNEIAKVDASFFRMSDLAGIPADVSKSLNGFINEVSDKKSIVKNEAGKDVYSLKSDDDIIEILYKKCGFGNFFGMLADASLEDLDDIFKNQVKQIEELLNEYLYFSNKQIAIAFRNGCEHFLIELIHAFSNKSGGYNKRFIISDYKKEIFADEDNFDTSSVDYSLMDVEDTIGIISKTFSAEMGVIEAFNYSTKVQDAYYKNVVDEDYDKDQALINLFKQVDPEFKIENIINLKNRCIADWKNNLYRLKEVISYIKTDSSYSNLKIFINPRNFAMICYCFNGQKVVQSLDEFYASVILNPSLGEETVNDFKLR